MKTVPILLTTLIFLVSSGGQLLAQTVSPTDFVRLKADELIAIVNRDVPPQSPEFAQRQEDLKQAVRLFIDYRELCQRALGNHWNDRSEQEQDSFVELMTRLIETNYTVKLGHRRMDQSYEVEYESEAIRNDRAVVGGTVTYEGEQTAVEIYLMQREDTWSVFDVVTDDVSIEETYAESFDKIISEEGWDALVQRLQDRLAELEQEMANQRQGS
ncbi:MAG: ABC transporter substrate-binding protein [Bradymonadales bacterium]|nr:ABC transporter substrate-binding protein [Bradymonadales bacterium]